MFTNKFKNNVLFKIWRSGLALRHSIDTKEISNWDDDEVMATPPATSDTTSTAAQVEPTNQYNVAGPSHQWNVVEPMETSPEQQRGNEALMETPGPGVSTGARRRDPLPGNWKLRRNSSHGRGFLYQGARRNQHQLFHSQNRETIFIPSYSTGLVIGKRGTKIHELEYAANVIIKIGLSDGINTDVTIYGTDDAIARAVIMIKDLILNTANTSSNCQDLAVDSQSYVAQFAQQADEACSVDQLEIDCKALCEQYKKNKEEQFAKLPPIIKDFYNEDPVVTAMSPEAVNNWRKENHDMKVRRNSHNAESLRPIPNPVLSFEQVFANYPQILHEIYNQGFTRVYPIQSQAWPIILRGDDLICIAPTGTGKTLAVLLTALIHVDGQPIPKVDRKGPSALIVASSRKLVIDIQKELLKYPYSGIRSVCLYKEGDRDAQVKVLSKGVDIVISTPERLNDLAMSRNIKLINFTFVALIEVDSMIDLGYDAQVRRALCNMRPDKQIIMTCANWAIGVRLLALSFMKDPIQMKLGALDEAAEKIVTQKIIFIEENEKENFVIQFINNMNPSDKVVIFCGQKSTATKIGIELTMKGIEYRSVHGDLTILDREAALWEVIHGGAHILLATDVACRDVNIQDLTHVINLDYPGQIEEYIDRLDRTGRAGRCGTALTCVTKDDWAHARDLILVLEERQQVVPDELEQMARRFEAMSMIGRGTVRARGNRGCGRYSDLGHRMRHPK